MLIAQERINNNQVYIFKTPKNFFEAQIRSVAEKSTRPGLALYLRCYRNPPKDSAASSGPIIRVQIPYVKKEVSLAILFRALGFVSDRQIMEHICYDPEDKQMVRAVVSRFVLVGCHYCSISLTVTCRPLHADRRTAPKSGRGVRHSRQADRARLHWQARLAAGRSCREAY